MMHKLYYDTVWGAMLPLSQSVMSLSDLLCFVINEEDIYAVTQHR